MSDFCKWLAFCNSCIICPPHLGERYATNNPQKGPTFSRVSEPKCPWTPYPQGMSRTHEANVCMRTPCAIEVSFMFSPPCALEASSDEANGASKFCAEMFYLKQLQTSGRGCAVALPSMLAEEMEVATQPNTKETQPRTYPSPEMVRA